LRVRRYDENGSLAKDNSGVVESASSLRFTRRNPASRLGLVDRGPKPEGVKTDLVLFDPKRVVDRSTFKEPLLFSPKASTACL
jgi:N-acyl-D-aspartate/D-glutamate deacylase